MEKKFTSFRGRLDKLRSRNMLIPKDSSRERNIIKKNNYYNLINGYKDPFLVDKNNYPAGYPQNEDLYITGTKPSHLEALMEFDQNLRNIFLIKILKIEDIIKNEIVQSFYDYHTSLSGSSKSLHRESEYLRREYYDLDKVKTSTIFEKSGYQWTYIHEYSTTTCPSNNGYLYVKSGYIINKKKYYDGFLSIVYRTMGNQREKNKSIESYLDNHRYLPMWVLINILTFGNVSTFYQVQKEEVQKEFSRRLELQTSNPIFKEDEINIGNIIHILGLFRNVCAHNERMYCIQVKSPIDDYYKSFGESLPFFSDVEACRLKKANLNKAKSKKRRNARHGIYSGMFAISLFLNRRDLNKFKSEISKELQTLQNRISDTSYQEVIKIMGLNFNWQDLLIKR